MGSLKDWGEMMNAVGFWTIGEDLPRFTAGISGIWTPFLFSAQDIKEEASWK